jgi:hypothetical protein
VVEFGSQTPQVPVFNCREHFKVIRYVDLDGTLAFYDGWKGYEHIGLPVPEMATKVKKWVADGDKIFIFTARVGPDSEFVPEGKREEAREIIEKWCLEHFGQVFEVTAEKGTFSFLYDDRAIQIVRDTGLTFQESVLNYIATLRQETDFADRDILRAVEAHFRVTNKT